jgi:uncharacterized protein
LNLRDWIRGLSGRSEFLLTVLIAFGLVIPRSVVALIEPQRLFEGGGAPITDRALFGTVIYELALLLVLGAFLRLRGWTLARLGISPAWRDSAIGLGLALAAYAGYAALWIATASLWPQIGEIGAATHLVAPDIGWPSIVLVSLVNPVFEELFVCGYVIVALREKRGVSTATAINVSAAIRVFCHFYQGAVGVLAVVPIALIFAYWFARTGRLWPLIVAHAALDFAGLAAHMS